MKDIFPFYKDILSKLPVSLVGYNNIEEELDKFLSVLFNNSFFQQYDNLELFSYSFSKLNNAKTWITKPLSENFGFYDLKERDTLICLSYYYYLKNIFDVRFNTINSLTQLFATDMSFRVGCNDKNIFNFAYIQDKNILSFDFPRNRIFNLEPVSIDSNITKYKQAEKDFKNAIKEEELNGKKGIYYVEEVRDFLFKRSVISNPEIERLYNDFFDQGFNKEQIRKNFSRFTKDDNTIISEEVLKSKLLYFIKTHPKLFVHIEDEATLENLVRSWASQCVSIAYLADLYKAWIEYLPATAGITNREEKRNLGSFIVGYSRENEINANDRVLFKLISERITYAVGGDHFRELMAETEKHATRAAISQVMARNMSHNIGSHVLSKMITEEQTNKVKKDCIQDYQCQTTVGNVTDKSNEKFIADFFDYLKCRMDYLADVTTNTPVIENINSLYGNIISPFIQNRVLNDRISGITNFNYEVILCKPVNNDACFGKETRECCYKILNGINDIQVSIPNDVVGRHAFYTILENIVRNTAKHAKKPKSGNVEFKIKIEEASVYNQCNDNIDWNAYFAISIFDNCIVESLQSLVESQNKKLNETILDNNKLRHGHWGLIEMDASAAYLRKIPVDKIDSDDYDIVDFNGHDPITKSGELAIFQAYSEQEKYLGYRFFLRKPQEILIITKDEDDKNEVLSKSGKDQNTLINEGIWIITSDAIKKETEYKTVYPHRLTVITSKAKNIENIILNNPLFSKRKIDVEDSFTQYSDANKMWDVYFSDKPKYKKQQDNSVEKNECGARDNHGENYCDLLQENKFVEINFSATDSFFKNGEYWYSWPTRIGIIDERVQAFSENEKYSLKENKNCKQSNGNCYHKTKVSYKILYKHTNIMVPELEKCDLNEQDFGYKKDDEDKTTCDKIIDFINDCTQKVSKDSDKGNGLEDSACEFIVIHIGIIEKLIKTINEKNEVKYDKDNADRVKAFILQVILKEVNEDDKSKIYDTLVITSGRGTPQNLPQDIRYLNFSTIYQYLTTQRNKYALTEALYSARKQTKI